MVIPPENINILMSHERFETPIFAPHKEPKRKGTARQKQQRIRFLKDFPEVFDIIKIAELSEKVSKAEAEPSPKASPADNPKPVPTDIPLIKLLTAKLKAESLSVAAILFFSDILRCRYFNFSCINIAMDIPRIKNKISSGSLQNAYAEGIRYKNIIETVKPDVNSMENPVI